MRASTWGRAVSMLSSLLVEGRSYREVGRAMGLGHSTVERQVKALLSQVAQVAPVTGVPDIDMAPLNRLRTHATAVMEAVHRTRPLERPQSPTGLDEIELLAGMRRLRRLSENPCRDVALLLTLLSTGAKPLEIARLRVRDYLGADGAVRRQSELAAGTALRGRERVVFFDSDRACDAIDAYLDERIRRGVGTSGHTTYRGLEPDGALFLTEGAEPFRVRARGRDDPRPTCPVLLATYAGIFRRAGWPGVNTQFARRQFAQRVAARGADPVQLATLLGVRCDRSVKRLLERPPRSLADLVKDLL